LQFALSIKVKLKYSKCGIFFKLNSYNNNNNNNKMCRGVHSIITRTQTFCCCIHSETLNHAFMVITNFGYGLVRWRGFQVYYKICRGIIWTELDVWGCINIWPGADGPPNCVYCAWSVLRSVRDDADIGTLRVIWVSVIRWM